MLLKSVQSSARPKMDEIAQLRVTEEQIISKKKAWSIPPCLLRHVCKQIANEIRRVENFVVSGCRRRGRRRRTPEPWCCSPALVARRC